MQNCVIIRYLVRKDNGIMNNKVIITIGREYGSGGHEVGKRLAAKLGIPLYDDELIQEAASKTGYNLDYVKANDEKAPELSIGSYFSGIDIYQSTPYDNIQFEQHKLIRDIASKGSCVIIGHAADYVLRDEEHVSVFVFAPIEDRIKRKLALLSPEEAEGMTEAAMEKKIKQMDKQRRRFYDFYTDNKWGTKESYDLCINTSRTGIDGAVSIIETMIKASAGKDLFTDM